jgi:hypothetical protein
MRMPNSLWVHQSGENTTYYDSAGGITITRERAISEIKSHGLDYDDNLERFFDDLGDKKLYSAQKVLNWLGY